VTFAALFPGQGSHAVGMASSFYASSAAARAVLDEAEAAFPGLLELMFEGPLEALTLTANQQPALVAAGAAAFAAWREAGGAEPVVTAGHSLGEFTAHVARGSLPLADAVRLVHARGRYMQDAVPAGEGAMAAILKLEEDHVRRLCSDAAGRVDAPVEIANVNAPGQVVVSGAAAAVAAVVAAAKEEGGRAVPLNVSAPFHCSMMQPAADRLADDLANVTFREGRFDLVCNVDAEPLPSPDLAATRLTSQVTAPVLWTASLTRIAGMGVERFVEFGSGTVLTGLVKRTLPEATAVSVDTPDALHAAVEVNA